LDEEEAHSFIDIDGSTRKQKFHNLDVSSCYCKAKEGLRGLLESLLSLSLMPWRRRRREWGRSVERRRSPAGDRAVVKPLIILKREASLHPLTGPLFNGILLSGRGEALTICRRLVGHSESLSMSRDTYFCFVEPIRVSLQVGLQNRKIPKLVPVPLQRGHQKMSFSRPHEGGAITVTIERYWIDWVFLI
jgi:hypothetical protein